MLQFYSSLTDVLRSHPSSLKALHRIVQSVELRLILLGDDRQHALQLLFPPRRRQHLQRLHFGVVGEVVHRLRLPRRVPDHVHRRPVLLRGAEHVAAEEVGRRHGTPHVPVIRVAQRRLGDSHDEADLEERIAEVVGRRRLPQQAPQLRPGRFPLRLLDFLAEPTPVDQVLGGDHHLQVLFSYSAAKQLVRGAFPDVPGQAECGPPVISTFRHQVLVLLRVEFLLRQLVDALQRLAEAVLEHGVF